MAPQVPADAQADEPRPDSSSVKSARRTLELLELVATHLNGVSFVDLAKELPYPKSSLHGLLHTIVRMRWLTFNPEDRRYYIGMRPWEIGHAFRPSREIAMHARRFLREANRQLDETVQLGILDDLDVVYIDKVDGTKPLRLVSDIGSRLSAYATGIGKALLSGLDDDVLADRFSGATLQGYTAKTITDGDELIKVLRTVRENGFAIDDGEFTHGVFCTAVPVTGPGGDVVAAISCSVPRARLDAGEADADQMTRALKAAAGGITHALSQPDLSI